MKNISLRKYLSSVWHIQIDTQHLLKYMYSNVQVCVSAVIYTLLYFGLFLVLYSRPLGLIISKTRSKKYCWSRKEKEKEKNVQRDDLTVAFTLIIFLLNARGNSSTDTAVCSSLTHDWELVKAQVSLVLLSLSTQTKSNNSGLPQFCFIAFCLEANSAEINEFSILALT